MSGLKRTKTLDIDYHKPDELQFESSHHVTRPTVQDDDSSSCGSEDDFAGADNDGDDIGEDETPPEITNYVTRFGATRGATSDALRDWHQAYALKHPKTGDPPPADCQGGCHWKDLEFSTACMACLVASTGIADNTSERENQGDNNQEKVADDAVDEVEEK